MPGASLQQQPLSRPCLRAAAQPCTSHSLHVNLSVLAGAGCSQRAEGAAAGGAGCHPGATVLLFAKLCQTSVHASLVVVAGKSCSWRAYAVLASSAWTHTPARCCLLLHALALNKVFSAALLQVIPAEAEYRRSVEKTVRWKLAAVESDSPDEQVGYIL